MLAITKSWRTASVGVVLFAQAFFTALYWAVDGVDSTIPDWNLVVTAGVAMLGFLTARDNQVSSEDAGVVRLIASEEAVATKK